MKESSCAGLARYYLVPAMALISALSILATHTNQTVFLLFNGLGPRTGDALWAHWTLLGDALVLLVLVLPFAGRRPALVWSMVITAVITGIAVSLMKNVVAAPRPPAVLAADLIHVIGRAYKSHSFPSGHTAAAFAFAGVLSLHFRRGWITVISVGLAVGVGISRMAVGVHWPLDVAAGAGLGWLCAVGGSYLARRWRWGESRIGQRVFALLVLSATFSLLLFFKVDPPATAFLPKGIAVMALIMGAPGLAKVWRDRA